MKIDIHTHTKKCKSGDAPTRDISPSAFCETIAGTEVRIIAITNHNVFDLEQYNEITNGLCADAQVWPGIELDIVEGGARGHLLVVVSPTRAQVFSDTVTTFAKGASPDVFSATIEEVVAAFDVLKPIYVAHYRQKKPNLSDEALELLVSKVAHPACVIKEATNSISAGIYISHGHASIYGSDIEDWSKYKDLSRELPDLRLPVDSFEQFCLLLEKDPTTIITLLDRKTSENILLVPFDDSAFLKLKVFNDIHVLFGPKGTGKTCILRAIAKYYSERGIAAAVYESGSDRLDEIFDTKGRDISFSLSDHGIQPCELEIESIRTASEKDITSLSKYVAHFTATATNKNARKMLLKDIEPEEEGVAKREFIDTNKTANAIADFVDFFRGNSLVKKELSADDVSEVSRILSHLRERLAERRWASFSVWKEVCLLNSAICAFRKSIERKTGTPAKPTTTGFRAYAMNRVTIQVHATSIVNSVGTEIPMAVQLVGSLGVNKGDLECRTEFRFQNGLITDGSFTSVAGVKKGTQKQYINQVRKILSHAYSDDLFQHVAELNEIEDVQDINTVHELMLFRRYFAVNGTPYVPSSGEASMVMLQKELGMDKDVYLLDEPERSLGNEYISDVIVPLIKERARAGKRIFISTHDANIAVRTLPYSSIYRCHGPKGYSTFVGNPFSNSLVNLDKSDEGMDWKIISMKTLEGGEDAFGERGRIYGHS